MFPYLQTDGRTDGRINLGGAGYNNLRFLQQKREENAETFSERARGTAARLGKEETKKKEIGPISRSAWLLVNEIGEQN